MPEPDSTRDVPATLPAGQRIVAGARRHFFAHGFRGVTMDDLATALGMSKKTLYAHFPTKSALLQAVLADKFNEVGHDLQQITAGDISDFSSALHDLLSCLRRHTDEIQPPFIRDIRREEPALYETVEIRRRENIQKYFGKLLSEGRKAGLVRKDIPLPLMIETLIGAVQSVMNPRTMEELGLTLKHGTMTIIRILLEGALTEEGRKNL